MIKQTANSQRNFFEYIFSQDRILFINFSILLFFLVFGTGLPWQEKSELYYQESSGGNLVNQVLFIFLFLSSLTIILPNINDIWYFVKKEKYLIIFISVCILSVAWSFDSFSSLKRSFEIFVLYLIAITSITYLDEDRLFKIMRVIISLYLLVTLFSCLFIPAAIDPDFGTWRGIHSNKNGLAQMGVLCFLLSQLFFRLNERTLKTIWNYLISLLSAFLIIMAGSSTAIVILFLLFLTIMIFKIEKVFSILRIKRFFLLFLMGFAVVTIIALFTLSTEIFALITEIFNKDLTLTGRTLFWPYLINEFKEHILLGYGYGAFWIMGSSHVNRFFVENGIRVNTAHNGFIDIAVQLGLSGLLPILLIIYSFIRRALITYDNLALLAILAILITNITETTLFQPMSITTFIFMFFYLRTSSVYFDIQIQSVNE